jgi:hypothetical protein
MTITITVETGAVVSGANSYVSLANFKTHCDDRGRVYTAVYGDEVIKAALVKMADYLDDLPYRGFKTDRSNPMAWPRYGSDAGEGNYINILTQPETYWVGVLDRDGYWIGISEVPAEVINAQCEGAWLILTGKDMEPNLDRGGQVKREKYDVVEFEYFSGASPTTEFKAVANRLRGLLRSSSTMDIKRG